MGFLRLTTVALLLAGCLGGGEESANSHRPGGSRDFGEPAQGYMTGSCDLALEEGVPLAARLTVPTSVQDWEQGEAVGYWAGPDDMEARHDGTVDAWGCARFDGRPDQGEVKIRVTFKANYACDWTGGYDGPVQEFPHMVDVNATARLCVA